MKDYLSYVLSSCLIMLGLAVLAGWQFGWESITNFWSPVSMKPTTAIGFLLTGIMFLCMSVRKYGITEYILSWSSMSVWALMAIILGESIYDVDVGITGLFITDKVDAILDSICPGEPSLMTCVSFLVTSTLGLLWIFTSKQQHKPILPWCIFGIGTLPIIGYVINNPLLYYHVEGMSTAMAFHTAVGFQLCGLLSLALGKHDGLNKRTHNVKSN